MVFHADGNGNSTANHWGKFRRGNGKSTAIENIFSYSNLERGAFSITT